MFVQDLDLNPIDTKSVGKKKKQVVGNFSFFLFFFCTSLEPVCCYWYFIFRKYKCNKCAVCKTFVNVFDELQDAYFFKPKKRKHQPVMWKVFFESGNKFLEFRIEIAITIESEDQVLNYDSPC